MQQRELVEILTELESLIYEIGSLDPEMGKMLHKEVSPESINKVKKTIQAIFTNGSDDVSELGGSIDYVQKTRDNLRDYKNIFIRTRLIQSRIEELRGTDAEG